MGDGPGCAAAPRPRRHARVAVRDRRRAEPALPRARARPPRLRILEQARARRLQRPLVRRDHARADGRARDRRRAPRRQLDGRPDRDRDRADWPPSGSRALGLLCPAVAWVKRGFHPIVRLLRPEFGLAPPRVPPLDGRLAVLEHLPRPRRDRPGRRRPDGRRVPPHLPHRPAPATRSSPRLATSTSRRRSGAGGFYPRLAELEPPALFIWGSHDPLVPAAFGRHVREWLPSAEQVTLDACGHVPQVERPDETNELLMPVLRRAERRPPADASPARDGPLETPKPPEARGVRDGARASPTAAPSRNGHRSDARPADEHGGRPRALAALRVLRGVAEQASRRIPRADLDERDPDFIRERLPLMWLLASLWYRGEVRGLGNIPDDGPGAARRQPLRRQHDPRHDRLHARVQHLLRGRARLLPARPQPRAVDAGARRAAQVRHRRRVARERRARRSTRAPRCSSTRAATTRSTARAGSATGSTSAGARASSGWRSSRTSRSCPSSRSAARRPRCSSPAASGSHGCSRSTGCSA